MPYNPGVVDRSGQILAQGILGRAQGRAGAATTLGQGIQDLSGNITAYLEETKQLKAKTKAAEDYIKQNPELFGVSEPDKLAAILAPSPDKTPRERYAQIQNFIEMNVFGSKLKQAAAQQKQAESENALRAIHMQQAQQQMAQQTAAERAMREAAAPVSSGVDPLLAKLGLPVPAPQQRSPAEVLDRFIGSGVTPTQSQVQLLNTRADLSAAEGANTTRAAQAEMKARQLQEQLQTQRDRLELANETLKLREQMDLLKREELRPGTKKTFTVGGAQREAIYTDKDGFVDAQTGIPLTTRVDFLGNQGGAVNPALLAAITGKQSTTGGPNPVLEGLRPSGEKVGASATPEFKTLAEAKKAYADGKISIGQTIKVGGKTGKWQ